MEEGRMGSLEGGVMVDSNWREKALMFLDSLDQPWSALMFLDPGQ